MEVDNKLEFEIGMTTVECGEKFCVICGLGFKSRKRIATILRNGRNTRGYICPRCIKSLATGEWGYVHDDWYENMIQHVSWLIEEVEKWDYAKDFKMFKDTVDFDGEELDPSFIELVRGIRAQLDDILLIELKDSFRKAVVEDRFQFPEFMQSSKTN